MNANGDTRDRVADALSTLPAYDVEPARAAEIRARCRAALADRTSRRVASGFSRGGPREAELAGRFAPFWRRCLEPALVAGLSVVFLAEVISRALRLEGF